MGYALICEDKLSARFSALSIQPMLKSKLSLMDIHGHLYSHSEMCKSLFLYIHSTFLTVRRLFRRLDKVRQAVLLTTAIRRSAIVYWLRALSLSLILGNATRHSSARRSTLVHQIKRYKFRARFQWILSSFGFRPSDECP